MSILKDSFIQYIINFLKPKIEAKQDKLTSGTNIATINGGSLFSNTNNMFDITTYAPFYNMGNKADIFSDCMYWDLNRSNSGIKIENEELTKLFHPELGECTTFTATSTGLSSSNIDNVFFELRNYSHFAETNPILTDDDYIDIDCIFIKLKCYSGQSIYLQYSYYSYWNGNVTKRISLSAQNETNIKWVALPMFKGRFKGRNNIRINFQSGVSRAFYTIEIKNIVVISNTNNFTDSYKNIFKFKNLAINNRYYDIDVNQNATFPANITATKHITSGGTGQQVLLGDGTLKPLSEIGGENSGEDNRYSQLLDLLSSSNYNIPDEGVVAGEYVWDDGSNNEEGIARLTYTPDGGKMLVYNDEFGWTEQTSAWTIPNIPVATTTSGGVMSPADKTKLDSLSTSIEGSMTISGTVNLTNGTFNTQNNSSLNSYTKVFRDMSVGEMRMYLVADSSGNLPSTSETAVTVPYDGLLSPAQVYFGKSAAFGVSVGDICVLFKKSSLLNICRIIPLNDVKPSNGDFPGADGLATVWDKERINKIDSIEWTANHVRDNYLPFTTQNGSNMNECLESGVYPWCSTGRPTGSADGTHFTCITQKSTTADWSGYYTYHQICFGRDGVDAGKIYQRIFFLKTDINDNPNWGNGWKRIDPVYPYPYLSSIDDIFGTEVESIEDGIFGRMYIFNQETANGRDQSPLFIRVADRQYHGLMSKNDKVKLDNTYTKDEVDTKLGDINTILESIINS